MNEMHWYMFCGIAPHPALHMALGGDTTDADTDNDVKGHGEAGKKARSFSLEPRDGSPIVDPITLDFPPNLNSTFATVLAKALPSQRHKLIGFVTSEMDALEWVGVFPEDREQVRHTIKSSRAAWYWLEKFEEDRYPLRDIAVVGSRNAYEWASRWPEDKDAVRDKITDSFYAVMWAGKFPEDKDIMRAIVFGKPLDSCGRVELGLSWVKHSPEDLEAAAQEFIKTYDDAVRWANRYPESRHLCLPAIKTGEEAFNWAKRYPEDRNQVRHLVTDSDSACHWGVTFKEDRAIMLPLLSNKGSRWHIQNWARWFPEDRAYLRGLYRTKKDLESWDRHFLRVEKEERRYAEIAAEEAAAGEASSKGQ